MTKEHSPKATSVEGVDQEPVSVYEKLGIPEGFGSAHPNHVPTSIYEGDNDHFPTDAEIRKNRQERGIDTPVRAQLKRSVKRLVKRVVNIPSAGNR